MYFKMGHVRLPGQGKGGMVQLALAGNVSMLVVVPSPPLIIRAAHENNM